MTNTKSTKRALLSSVLALVVCIAMLVGSTFAWFTDNASTAVNQIVAGNLDIVLEYQKTDGSWDNAEGKTLEWVKAAGAENEAILWEPGCTYKLPALRVRNEGNLALKYTLVINGVIGDAGLLKVIDFTANDQPISNFNGKLYAKGETDDTSDAIVIKGHMQETAGNEYMNATLSGISVAVFATQLNYENDSYGPDYDKIALVSDAEELADAIASGENVTLTDDITVDANNTITVADDANIVLDLNGHDINGTSSTDGKNRALFTVKGEMNVIGDGTVSMVYTGANMGWNNLSAPFSVESGTLTLGKDVNVINLGGTDMAYAVDVNTTLGETVLNVDGATLYSTYIGVRIFNNHTTAKGTVNYNSGIIYGAKNGYDIWAQLMSKPAENAVVNIADGINYTTEDKSGKMYYIADDVAYVSTAAALQTAIKNSQDVIFVSDITVDEWIMFSETKTIGNGQIITVAMNGLTIDGNGHTLTVNSIESATNGDLLFDDASNLNISNLTIKYADGLAGGINLESGVISNVTFIGGGNMIYPGTGEITVENCTFIKNGAAFYNEHETDKLTVTGCTFNLADDRNIILIRGDVKFTNNTVNSGRTVNIVSGSPVVTGNNFNNVRLKVYENATATVSDNTINNLAFETASYKSTFAGNILSAVAQAALNAANKI